MTGFLVTIGTDVRPDLLGPYSAALPPIYAAHGGRYLALGGPGRGCEALGVSPPRSAMVAAFPTLDAVGAFWRSPAYRAAVPLRDGCGRFDVVALSGHASPAAPAAILVALGGERPPTAPLAGPPAILLEGVPPGPEPLLFAPDTVHLPALLEWAAACAAAWRLEPRVTP